MDRTISTIILLLAFPPNSAFAETACEFSQHAPRRHESLQRQYGSPEESIHRAKLDATRDRGNVSTIQSRNKYHNHTTSENKWNVGNLNFTFKVGDVAVYVCDFKHDYVPLLVIIVFYLFSRIRTNTDHLSRKTCGLDPRRCAAVHCVAVHLRFSQDETLRPPCRDRGGSPMKLCIGPAPISKVNVFVNGDCCEVRDRQGDSYFRRSSMAARSRTRRRCRSVLPARYSAAASTAPRSSSRGQGVPPKCVQWSRIRTDE